LVVAPHKSKALIVTGSANDATGMAIEGLSRWLIAQFISALRLSDAEMIMLFENPAGTVEMSI